VNSFEDGSGPAAQGQDRHVTSSLHILLVEETYVLTYPSRYVRIFIAIMLINSIVFIILCNIFTTCDSHGIMTFPTPRTGIARNPNNPTQVIKLTPIQNYRNQETLITRVCGGTDNRDSGRRAVPLENKFRPGATVKVEWDITIAHPSTPGVKISVCYDDAVDCHQENVLVKEGHEAGDGGNPGNPGKFSKSVTLNAEKKGVAVMRWQWCSNQDQGCYITCADILVDPSAPAQVIENTGNGNNGVSATIDGSDGGGGAGLTVFIVFLVIAILAGLAYAGYMYWSKLEREKFEANIRDDPGANAAGVAMQQVGGAFSAQQTETTKRRRQTFKDNSSIRRPPPTSKAGKLADGWHEAIDEASGDKYYYHDDGSTCWDKPQRFTFESRTPRYEEKSSLDGNGLPLPAGKFYIHNKKDHYFFTRKRLDCFMFSVPNFYILFVFP
jgi:hypothetical protein